MNKCHWAIAMTLLSSGAWAGEIAIGTPLVSGTETAGHEHVEPLNLSPAQLRVIWHWLETHQSGWHEEIEPTSEPIEMQLELKHTDGGTTSIAVVASSTGERSLRITGPAAHAYKSFGGLVKAKFASRPFSSKEFQSLQRLLARPEYVRNR